MRLSVIGLSLLCLAGCAEVPVTVGGPAFVSTQSPQSGNSAQSLPEPATSVPPGAGGLQPNAANATQPDLAAVTVSVPGL
jgi:hypothetical protein